MSGRRKRWVDGRERESWEGDGGKAESWEEGPCSPRQCLIVKELYDNISDEPICIIFEALAIQMPREVTT